MSSSTLEKFIVFNLRLYDISKKLPDFCNVVHYADDKLVFCIDQNIFLLFPSSRFLSETFPLLQKLT